MRERRECGTGDANRQYIANRVRTRREPGIVRDYRFGIGVAVFLAVALAYPWYDYAVSAYLLKRDLEDAALEFTKASEEGLREIRKQTAQAAEASRRDEQRRRVGKVRVKGVSDGPTGHVVIVDLGAASVVESEEAICRQAEAWLRRDLADTALAVQRYRGNAPALDAGIVVCPKRN